MLPRSTDKRVRVYFESHKAKVILRFLGATDDPPIRTKEYLIEYNIILILLSTFVRKQVMEAANKEIITTFSHQTP